MYTLNMLKLAEIKCLSFLHSHCAGKAKLVNIVKNIFLKVCIVLFAKMLIIKSITLFVSNYIAYRSFLYSGHVFTVQEGI